MILIPADPLHLSSQGSKGWNQGDLSSSLSHLSVQKELSVGRHRAWHSGGKKSHNTQGVFKILSHKLGGLSVRVISGIKEIVIYSQLMVCVLSYLT